MPTLDVTVPHNLSQTEAKDRIQNLIQDLQTKFGGQIKNLSQTWSDHSSNFSFEAQGFKVSGQLSVHPSHMHLTAQIPMAALPFRGMIERVIKEKAAALLS